MRTERELRELGFFFWKHLAHLGCMVYYYDMDTGDQRFTSEEDVQRSFFQAGKVFLPNTAVSTHELFSGRKRQITLLLDTINQTGLHAVIFGERGVGKTSLANIVKPFLAFLEKDLCEANKRVVVKINSHAADTFSEAWRRALGELHVQEPQMGFKPNGNSHTSLAHAHFTDTEISIDDVRRLLPILGDSVFVFDEFDRMPHDEAKAFTDLIKTLSDYAISTTIVLVGVAATVDALVADHQSVPRAITEISMPRMHPEELRAILAKGENGLGMKFESDAADFIVKMSQGLPHYTHLIGQRAVRSACGRKSRLIALDDVSESFREAATRAQQSIVNQFTLATRSAHKDALYGSVLLACAITASRSIDSLGFFQPASVVEPLKGVLPNREIQIATFSNHLGDFCEEKRGSVLERTGQQRNYRYRFRNPLMPPFVIMNGLSNDLISVETVTRLVKTSCQEGYASDAQFPLF